MKLQLQRLVSLLGYPVFLALPIVATVILMGRELPVWAATGLPALAIVLLVLPLERAMPYTPKWQPSWRVFGLDLLHTLVASNVIAPFARITAFALLAQLGTAATEQLGFSLWPHTWPMVLQLTFAVLLADLGAYSAHRWMHLTRVGWRIHAVHHSMSKMHVIAAARTHPFNGLLTLSLETGPLILLGVSPEAFAAWTVWKAVNGLLQHSNVDFRPGWLSWVLATNDVHRWHHSVKLDESNTNFGNSTMVWDQVFRTFFLPANRRPRLEVGVADAVIPENYLMHLATPFWLDRFEAEAKEPTGQGLAS